MLQTGVPTWRVLVEGLKDLRVGQISYTNMVLYKHDCCCFIFCLCQNLKHPRFSKLRSIVIGSCVIVYYCAVLELHLLNITCKKVGKSCSSLQYSMLVCNKNPKLTRCLVSLHDDV